MSATLADVRAVPKSKETKAENRDPARPQSAQQWQQFFPDTVVLETSVWHPAWRHGISHALEGLEDMFGDTITIYQWTAQHWQQKRQHAMAEYAFALAERLNAQKLVMLATRHICQYAGSKPFPNGPDETLEDKFKQRVDLMARIKNHNVSTSFVLEMTSLTPSLRASAFSLIMSVTGKPMFIA